jgi:hypothetical protein
MSSLVSKSQQPTSFDEKTAFLFLKLGIFSRYHPVFNEIFQCLKNLKNACDVILFVSQLTISMRENIQELFGQIGIQIPEEHWRLFMEIPIESFESFIKWNYYFTNNMNEKQRETYRQNYQNQFIPFEELISFSKSFY